MIKNMKRGCRLIITLAQVVPVIRSIHAIHAHRHSLRAGARCSLGESEFINGSCALGNETTEVWLDHLDDLSTVPRRGFHSAFEEADLTGAWGMQPWTTIYGGISRGSTEPFNLVFVFGGMQMTSVEESDGSVLAMDGDTCFHSNQRVLNALRGSWLSQSNFDPTPEKPSLHRNAQRVLVISRNGTWWRRWLNEKVLCTLTMFKYVRVLTRTAGVHDARGCRVQLQH
jgi:hypothetical protein